MGRKPKCTHRKLMRAIENSSGIISVIAKRLNVSWVVANNSIKRDSEAYQFYLDECEKIIDVAESVVISSIRDNKDVNTAKWYLPVRPCAEPLYSPDKLRPCRVAVRVVVPPDYQQIWIKPRISILHHQVNKAQCRSA